MTTSLTPIRASFSRCQTISGLPPAISSGLGVVSVSGRMRSPLPAAKIRACMSGARLREVAAADRAFDQRDHRRDVRIPLADVAGVFPHERQVAEVTGLAVAIP